MTIKPKIKLPKMKRQLFQTLNLPLIGGNRPCNGTPNPHATKRRLGALKMIEKYC